MDLFGLYFKRFLNIILKWDNMFMVVCLLEEKKMEQSIEREIFNGKEVTTLYLREGTQQILTKDEGIFTCPQCQELKYWFIGGICKECYEEEEDV